MKNTAKTKKMTIQGLPIEHVVQTDPILRHCNLSYSGLMRLVTDEFLSRVRNFKAQLDQGKTLKMDHDLAKYAALCVHTWDDRPMEQYIENNKKPENKRTVWTWKPEIVKKEEV